MNIFRGTPSEGSADRQKKLLQDELSRQGMTKGAADSMTKSASCVQSKTTENGSLEEW